MMVVRWPRNSAAQEDANPPGPQFVARSRSGGTRPMPQEHTSSVAPVNENPPSSPRLLARPGVSGYFVEGAPAAAEASEEDAPRSGAPILAVQGSQWRIMDHAAALVGCRCRSPWCECTACRRVAFAPWAERLAPWEWRKTRHLVATGGMGGEAAAGASGGARIASVLRSGRGATGRHS
jgi:hypothetical protein